MSWIMTIAVGAAIGYFAYQIFLNNKNGEAFTGRLHKSTKDKKIAGVCGGIAEYLNTDPTIIRLVFALMVLGWGTGVMAYIVLALVLPEGNGEE